MAERQAMPPVGAQVRITDGPLTGFAAEVREVDNVRGRLKIDAAVKQMRVPIEVESWQVAAP
jgi:transcription antitermination factor NusG